MQPFPRAVYIDLSDNHSHMVPTCLLSRAIDSLSLAMDANSRSTLVACPQWSRHEEAPSMNPIIG